MLHAHPPIWLQLCSPSWLKMLHPTPNDSRLLSRAGEAHVEVAASALKGVLWRSASKESRVRKGQERQWTRLPARMCRNLPCDLLGQDRSRTGGRHCRVQSSAEAARRLPCSSQACTTQMPEERELVRRQAGQVEQEEKPKRARVTKAKRVKDKTHEDPLPAHKQLFLESARPGRCLPLRRGPEPPIQGIGRCCDVERRAE